MTRLTPSEIDSLRREKAEDIRRLKEMRAQERREEAAQAQAAPTRPAKAS
jgi:hypothetical protein